MPATRWGLPPTSLTKLAMSKTATSMTPGAHLTVQEEAVPNRFKYTGQQLDPITQQYYLRARFYNPVIARFTQEDTYRGDGLNLYAYCTNNPICYVDPTGHYSNCVKAAYDRIREENPTLSAKEAYQRALQERGFDKLSKEDNRRRSEAANLNRQLKDPNLTPAERDQIYKKLDEVNNEFSGSNQKSTPHAETPTAESSVKGQSGTNVRTRLPRNNGYWEGEVGNSLWHSDIEAVNKITGGEGIPFVNGRPDFSKWSQGTQTFKLGELNGTNKDFIAVYKKLMADSDGKLTSQNAAKLWLKNKGWTPHHNSTTTIIFVPRDLHGNIPHIGSASDMRGDMK